MEIATELIESMVAHSRAGLPNEACGLLAVDAGGVVREVYCLDNAQHSPIAFTVDPDGHYRSLMAAEAKGWLIGGAFHSHPNSPGIPSRTDIAGALEPGWLHVIVGHAAGDHPEVRFWRIVAGRAAEEPVAASVRSSGEEGTWR